MDVWIAYSYSLHFSDQFSCIKFFDPSYGLKVIDFQSFNQLKVFLDFFYYFNSNIIRNSADRGGPPVRFDLVKPHCSG